MSNSKMFAAAVSTLMLAKEHGMHMMSSDNERADYEHLAWMLDQMSLNSYDWDQAKMGRWLGWIQACVYVMCEEVELEDMIEINKGFVG